MEQISDHTSRFVLHHYEAGRFDPHEAYARFAEEHRPRRAMTLWRLTAVAASLLLLVAGGAYWWQAWRLTTLTADAHVTTFQLADGTRAVLSPGSSLSWRGSYERQVSLSGRGYFEVTHHSDHSFTVRGDHYSVTDLGTRFMVAEEQGLTRVLVSEGMVAFGATASPSSLRLRAGMEAILLDGATSPRLIGKAHPNAMSWATLRFHFDHTPLSEVLSDLEHHYGVSLHASDLHRSLTGDFTADSLSTLIPVIEQALEVEIRW